MTQVTFIFLCAFVVVSSATAEQRCGANEMEVCSGDCASDWCPRSEDDDQTCAQPEPCTNRCKCIFNYRRAENRTCIPTEMCPPFACNRQNEEYTACPPLCADSCSNATPDGDCPPTFGFIGIVLPCTPACRCVKHHWRKNGTCVPRDECD